MAKTSFFSDGNSHSIDTQDFQGLVASLDARNAAAVASNLEAIERAKTALALITDAQALANQTNTTVSANKDAAQGAQRGAEAAQVAAENAAGGSGYNASVAVNNAATAVLKASEALQSRDVAVAAKADAEAARDVSASARDTAVTKAAAAAASATTASDKAAQLAAQLFSFNTVYLGKFAVAPTADGNGNPIQVGAIYENTTVGKIFAWENGAWHAYDEEAQTATNSAVLSASNAAGSASTAAARSAEAATNAGYANDRAVSAASSATAALNSASAANTYAGNAGQFATNAQNSATAAAASATTAANTLASKADKASPVFTGSAMFNKASANWASANRTTLEVDGADNVLLGLSVLGVGKAYLHTIADGMTELYGSGGLRFSTNGNERMRIASAGNVLIGTTTDNGVDRLQVNGSTKHFGMTTFAGGTTGAGTNLSLSWDAAGGHIQSYSNLPLLLNELGNRVLVGTTVDNGTDTLQVNGTAKIANTLNLGLGSTGANNAVIYMNGGSATNTGPLIIGQRNSVTKWSIGSESVSIGGGGDDLVLAAPGLKFYSGGFSRMSLNSAGRLLLGTTTDDGASSLQVNGAITNSLAPVGVGAVQKMSVYSASDASDNEVRLALCPVFNNDPYGAFVGAKRAGAAYASHLTLGTNNVEKMRVSSGGNVLIGSTTDDGASRLQVNGAAKVNGAMSVISPLVAGSVGQDLYVQRLGGTGGSDSVQAGANLYLGGPNNGATIQLGASTGSLNFFTYDGSLWGQRMKLLPSGLLVGDGNSTSVWATSGRGLMELGGSTSALLGLKVGNIAAGYLFHNGIGLDLFNGRNGPLTFWTNAVQQMTLDATGNLLVGTTAASTYHRLNKTVADGATILTITGGTGGASVSVVGVDTSAGSANASVAALYLGKHSTTARSLNASGTLNASGADYAEYMTKAEGTGAIPKGAVVGVDSLGNLTDKYADAVSFVLKSTDPSYVGGDTWGAGLEGEALEAARAKVDRIAFAGQVPVNVYGCKPGQYIVPNPDGVGITGVAVSEDDMTLKQYLRAVGIVQNILPDGRANVRVKVA